MRRAYPAGLFFALVCCCGGALAESKNGFLLDNALVPADEIHRGGPPRDGIPALTHPNQVLAEDADYLDDDDRVLALYRNGEAQAYPIRILNYHEIVNDTVGGRDVVITYCPLCGSGVAFKARVGERSLDFGVSGLLYNSDVLLYDRQTGSLWSQLMGKAISGRLKGQELTMIPVVHTTWEAWRERHPRTGVLSLDTGHDRNYDRNPYAGYERMRQLHFPVSHQAPSDYHPKERVVGLSLGGVDKAYPFKELDRHGERKFTDTVAGEQVTVYWDPQAESARIYDAEGGELAVVPSFWFAWYTFHPQTEVFKASE